MLRSNAKLRDFTSGHLTISQTGDVTLTKILVTLIFTVISLGLPFPLLPFYKQELMLIKICVTIRITVASPGLMFPLPLFQGPLPLLILLAFAVKTEDGSILS